MSIFHEHNCYIYLEGNINDSIALYDSDSAEPYTYVRWSMVELMGIAALSIGILHHPALQQTEEVE